ncbi:MAG TPA: Flp pilus assembly protein CpaB [Phenylobacterium sp.]|uniref:Flp pilus assembly protein CpaB n=1 Tax=Phenylobacterium sp. TaxID=1871053 RepID=UPI002B4A9068|nr:Flp pilus assembly protein CpaB [Phenylobacterium sp.]HKR88607.1 Flp pilus assembly protein CpaB [Phenylobacterium sp.]
MRVITIVSLGASAVLGLAALVVAKTVLPNQASAKIPGVAGAPVEGVPVVVAAKDMKYGDRVAADSLKLIRMPADVVPQGAFSTVAAVLSSDKGGPPVVLTPIAAREPLLPIKLSGPGARPSVAAEIKDGMRAYTVKVSDVSGVGGHALPGDRVDVMMMRDLDPSNPNHNYVSEVVLQDVRVLAIDLNADLASDKPATPATATLELSVADSQKLSVAADLGKLSLALRRTGSAEVTPTALVRANVFASGPGRIPTSGRAPASSSRRGGVPVGYGILIIEGERRHGGGGGPSATAAALLAPAPPAAPAAANAVVG